MISKTIIIGNVGNDPEIKTLPSGKKVVNISVATSHNYRVGEEWINETEWHSIVMWNDLAERVGRTVKKGMQVYVEGRLKTKKWEKDNIKFSKTGIIAHTFRILGKKEETTTQTETSKPYSPNAGADADDDVPF